MKFKGKLATAFVAFATLAAAIPAQAADSLASAEKLRKLDVMLMVTGLRCRTGADNFNAEYGRFTTSHLAELNAAGAQLKAQMAARYGAASSARALDRLSTTMANTYGNGHPWLSCAELKTAAAGLAQVKGHDTLLEAADQLLADGRGAQFAIARRR
jgi:hypothetical protein